MKAREPERLLAKRLDSNRNREERIERAKQLKAHAEKHSNARPASFSNRAPRGG